MESFLAMAANIISELFRSWANFLEKTEIDGKINRNSKREPYIVQFAKSVYHKNSEMA